MTQNLWNTSQTSLNSLVSIEEKSQCFVNSYNHEDLKEFLSKSSIKDLFPFAYEIAEAKTLLNLFYQALSCELPLNIKQLGDLYMLAIFFMTYHQENQLVMLERLKLVHAIANLSDHLDVEDVNFIAYGLYEKFVNGIGGVETVIALLASIPALIRASSLASNIALNLLLIIIGTYAKVPFKLEKTGNQAKCAFEMAQLINWKHLVDSGLHVEMFMLIKSFGMIINCRRIRIRCHDSLGSDIHKYFLRILKTNETACKCGELEMMIERYIAYCVVRGATL